MTNPITIFLLFVLVNSSSGATLQQYSDGDVMIPSPIMDANSTDAFACVIKTYPRPFPSRLAIFGHTSIMVSFGNGTLVTASLTGKVGQPDNCYQDNLLVNRNCRYHKGLEVTINKCAYLNESTLADLIVSIQETHVDNFQKSYSLLDWNCVIWATETWNLLGLPTIDWHIFPIPHLVW
jgi:hypothetical protein